jgi:hypothetical protein
MLHVRETTELVMAHASSTFRPDALARKVFAWTLIYAVVFAAAAVSILMQP